MVILKSLSIRLAYAVLLLLAVVVLNFTMLHLAPGDVADTIAQSMGGASEEVLAEIRADYGLDQPFLSQLTNYIGKVVQLDFGQSFFYNQPVFDLIMERLPATLLLVISAQLLAMTVGVILGVISACNPNGWSSHFVTGLALFGYSAPVYWVGILLLIAFSLELQWFPSSGMRDVALQGDGWAHFC